MNISIKMETLHNNSLFNVGGSASILSFFGLNTLNWANLASINAILIVCIGVFSLVFTGMKIYHQYLVTKKLKKKDKDV